MKCKVDGCGREAMYTEQAVCQKHYFRFMRNGSYELQPRSRIQRMANAKGYQKLFDPAHPLAMSDGYVYEHRAVVFARYGHALPACELCGAPTSWETCHIDHRDESVDNNDLANLRPLCRPCNVGRTERSSTPRFEFRGERKTLTEWMALPGVQVGRARAHQRLKAGWSIERALFGKNQTHPKVSP